ncbi:MAG: hypothetical protein ACRDQ1_01055 [Sciscionella sp.]
MDRQQPVLAGDGTAMVRVALAAGSTTDRSVGDLATVRALMSWGRGRVNLSAVEVLQQPHTPVGPRDAARMAWQLRRAAELCDRERASGLGLSRREASGLVWGFACPDEPLLLLTEDPAWVAASRSGLLLQLDGRAGRTVLVQGWRVGEPNVTACTDRGVLELRRDAAARLLTRLAPGMDRVAVAPVPLRSVFCGLFVGLVDLAAAASTSGSALLIRHGPARPGY